VVRSLHATQQHNTIRVICTILRHRPCQNFLPGVLCVTQRHRITYLGTPRPHRTTCEWSQVRIDSGPVAVSGLFVPLHFRSRERKVHRENFRSVELRFQGAKSPSTFVAWNFRTPNFRSSGANVPRNSAPWNFRTLGTFAPQNTFVPFNLRSCGIFAPVL